MNMNVSRKQYHINQQRVITHPNKTNVFQHTSLMMRAWSITTREHHSSTHIFPNFKEKYTEDVKFHKLIKI